MESNCKFLKIGICTYKHVTSFNDEEKLRALNKELNVLRNEIIKLTDEIKEKEQMIEKVTTENSMLKKQAQNLCKGA